MIHLGDITKISGYDVPIVDCVIGGSPCQDLSVAGKRAGLDGERSGLFMEQIRIIKEMREKDGCNGRTGEFIRPRFMVWENVPGALSSNKGEDFKAVLEETAKIIDKDAVIPMPIKGKWSTSGAIVGDGWSIAWRILDAQFWGVPQRRRRITLIADFGGGCASEILFERKGLHGHSSQSRAQRQGTPTDAQGGSLADDREGEGFDGYNGCLTGNVSSTIGVNCGMTTGRNGVVVKATGFPLGFRPECVVMDRSAYNQGVNAKFDIGIDEEGVAFSCIAKGPGAVCYCLQGNQIDQADTSVCNGSGWKEDSSYTLNTRDRHSVAYGVEVFHCLAEEGKVPTLKARDWKDPNCVVYEKKPHYIVRRLTPMECERLQGFPDLWTEIGEYTDSKGKVKKTSDSARYKALGNSIALPPWKWVIKRICSHYERDATMASLFDGIGGFPFLWEQINGKGSCLWASEIEDFPIAVTKVRIE